jgi:organic radical activating enzyme
LLSAVEQVYYLNVIGGEPFVHPQLQPIFEFALKQPKIKRVSATTNGTIIPRKELLEILRNPKTIVNISDYGDLSAKRDELADILNKNGVRYNINESSWHEYGDMNPCDRDIRLNTQTISACGYCDNSSFE